MRKPKVEPMECVEHLGSWEDIWKLQDTSGNVTWCDTDVRNSECERLRLVKNGLLVRDGAARPFQV